MTRIHLLKPGTFRDMNGADVRFTAADIAAIAKSYDPQLSPAPIVIGHPRLDDPAYGWTSGLTADDDGLHADAEDVDPAFADLVRAGRYRTVSGSFYRPDAPGNPKPGGWYLRHIGFLGAQPPAVKGLKRAQLAAANDGVTTVEFSAAADSDSALWSQFKRWLKNNLDLAEQKKGEAGDGTSPEARSLIGKLRQSGMSFQDISAELEKMGPEAERAPEILSEIANGDIHNPPDSLIAFLKRIAPKKNADLAEEDFAGPHQSFPVRSEADVKDAWDLAGKAADPDIVRRNVIAIAKRRNWTGSLPDAARAWAKSHDIQLSEENSRMETDLKKREAELAEREKSLKAREDTIAATEALKRKSDCAAFADGLVKEGKLLPADKTVVVELLLGIKPDYKVELADGSGTKTVSAETATRDFLSRLPKIVPLGEHARGQAAGGAVDTGDPVALAEAADELVAEAAKKGKTITHAEAVSRLARTNEGRK